MTEFILTYFYGSMIIMVILTYDEVFHSENIDDINDTIELLSLEFNLNKFLIYSIMFLFVALFAWVLLPLEISINIMNRLSGKER